MPYFFLLFCFVEIIEAFIRLANKSKKLNNFNAVAAIVWALDSEAVARLHRSWEVRRTGSRSREEKTKGGEEKEKQRRVEDAYERKKRIEEIRLKKSRLEEKEAEEKKRSEAETEIDD